MWVLPLLPVRRSDTSLLFIGLFLALIVMFVRPPSGPVAAESGHPALAYWRVPGAGEGDFHPRAVPLSGGQDWFAPDSAALSAAAVALAPVIGRATWALSAGERLQITFPVQDHSLTAARVQALATAIDAAGGRSAMVLFALSSPSASTGLTIEVVRGHDR